MGGLSKGKVSFTEDGTLLFNGKLSLENNGGFSSLRTRDVKLDLSDSDGLEMRVKGDGRKYQVRIASDARYRGMEVSFAAEFATKKGEWIKVQVPFAKLVGSWRGRNLSDETFNSAKIQRLGLILADKKPGPFELEIDWIRATSGASGGGDIVDIALADGRFGTLAAALTAAELVEVLKSDGPFTVFAPTDEAFAKLPEGTVESLLKPENRAQLVAVLKYHVVAGKVGLADALKAANAKTVQGDSVAIAFSGGQVRVNDSAILTADIAATNGIIHVVDAVLLPPTKAAPEPKNDILGVAKSAKAFGTLLAAVEAAGLTDVLSSDGPLTVLAPTDEAFAKLPKGTVESLLKPENIDQLKAVLTYHVVAGKVSAGDALNARSAATVNGATIEFGIKDGRFQVNGATILKTDIGCDNGVIHVIDTVLLPPCDSSEKDTAKTSKLDPEALIEDAISRGVPAFNDGDPAGCVKIYKECLKGLVADDRVDAKTRALLKEVLKAASKVDDPRELAWLYRSGLDLAYQVVSD